MKKKSLLAFLTTTVLLSVCSVAFTSCDDDDDYGYGYGDNDFYDSRLNGYWKLVSANDFDINYSDTNWLFFNGGGRGVYYYYLNDSGRSEEINYFCQLSGGPSTYQINLKYLGSGQTSTMSYWFNGNSYLYMQWRNQSGLQTYLYQRVFTAPW